LLWWTQPQRIFCDIYIRVDENDAIKA